MTHPANTSKPSFACLSFSELSPLVRREVLACTTKSKHDVWPIDLKSVFLNRARLPAALARANAWVETLDKTTFSSLTEAEFVIYEEELAFAFYLALADCELAILEGRADLDAPREKLFHTGALLAALRRKTPEKNQAILDAEEAIVAQLDRAQARFKVDDAAEAVSYPASFNDGRLYLVWAAEMLQDTCAILDCSNFFFSCGLAEILLAYVSLGTGYMGWSLYFLRGGVDVAALFEMSEAAASLALSEEELQAFFDAKWQQRKFSILNDAVWGLVNFVCFFILYGGGMLGYYGDVLNGVLFFFDCALILWERSEKEAAYEALRRDFEAAIAAEKDPLRRQFLVRAYRKVMRDHAYEVKQLTIDAMYSAALIVAFAILCCFFAPPGFFAAQTVSMMMFVGSVLCFLLSTMKGFHTAALEIKKTREAMQDEDADAAYYEQLLFYQKAKQICTLLTDTLLPALFLFSFVFTSQPLGAALFVTGLTLMFAAKCYVASLAPEDVESDSMSLYLLRKGMHFFAAPEKDEAEKREKAESENFWYTTPFNTQSAVS